MTEAEKTRRDILAAAEQRDKEKPRRAPTPVETDGLRIKPTSRTTVLTMNFIRCPRGWTYRHF